MSEEWDEKAALECANGDPRLAAFHKELCEIADENPSLSFRLYCAIDTAARRAFCDRRSPPAPAIDVEGVAKERDELLRERADLLLLWRWGAGGKVGTGFAEVLGGDSDGETWAVRFDPMSPDDSADFVVRITMGEDGMPTLDDAARAALGGKEQPK